MLGTLSVLVVAYMFLATLGAICLLGYAVSLLFRRKPERPGIVETASSCWHVATECAEALERASGGSGLMLTYPESGLPHPKEMIRASLLRFITLLYDPHSLEVIRAKLDPTSKGITSQEYVNHLVLAYRVLARFVDDADAAVCARVASATSEKAPIASSDGAAALAVMANVHAEEEAAEVALKVAFAGGSSGRPVNRWT